MTTEEKCASHFSPARGFARYSPEKRRELAAKGGANVPAEKRSYSVNKELASESGKKGGKNLSKEKRSFFRDRTLAQDSGRKGGRAAQANKRGKDARS